ncbi:MAG TPA: ferredoxin--NADP reductase [Chitinophagaceae bacterium]|nr:ferredoxin--NADP reductase [Chitinophagaceae bacterium]
MQQLKIRQIITETSNVKTFVLDSGEQKIDYKAGQYLTFVFDMHGHEVRRSYSIASSPVLDEPLAITFKRVQNGAVSRPLFDAAQEGDVLLTTGAAGFFVLPQQLERGVQLMFMAAGSGIVPIFSMIKTALHLHPGVPVVLIYSNRSEPDTIYYRELLQLQERFADTFRIQFLFSSSANLMLARLNKELVEVLVRQYAVVPLNNLRFYICGPFAYMRMIEMELHTMGVRGEHLRKEQFETIRPPVRVQPPDKEAHRVEIRMKDVVHELVVQYPVTILEAAKKKGIVLPYSCEVGKCGSCAALCLRGTVWMTSNEVLLNDEIRKGLVLTCTGFPVGGEVVLSL